MFRTEAQSRAFFDSPDFLLALAVAILAAAVLALLLTRTRVGRLVFLLALGTLCVACALVLCSVARLAALVTGLR